MKQENLPVIKGTESVEKLDVDAQLRLIFEQAKREVQAEKIKQGEPIEPYAQWLDGHDIDEAEFSEMSSNDQGRAYLERLLSHIQAKLDRLTDADKKVPEWQEGIGKYEKIAETIRQALK